MTLWRYEYPARVRCYGAYRICNHAMMGVTGNATDTTDIHAPTILRLECSINVVHFDPTVTFKFLVVGRAEMGLPAVGMPAMPRWRAICPQT